MSFNKKGLVVVGILVIIGLLYVFDGDITGEVVWEPATVVNNCSEVAIRDLWIEVFEEGDAGITIYREIPVAGENCTRFGVIKSEGGDEIWNLYYSLSDSGNIVADYANVTAGLYADIMALSDVDGLEGVQALLVSRLDEVNNYSMDDGGDALAFFESKFTLTSGAMAYSRVGVLLYFSEESSSDSNWEYSITYSVFENKSFAGVLNRINPVARLIEDIPDFEFGKNSSWNDAFDVGDYFDVAGGIVVNFSSVGSNNTDGEWINYSVLGGVVSFKPAVNFTGYRMFKMVANVPGGDDVFSNTFNVSIEILNAAPVLLRDIEDVGVPWDGWAEVYLDVYFNDSDGDNLTFRAAGDVAKLDINITDDVMILRLKEGFNLSKIWVYADDGIEETRSNKFWVFDSTDAVVVNFVANDGGDDDSDTNVSEDTTPSATGNESGSSTGSDDSGDDSDEDGFNWLLWVGVGVIVLLLVLFAIWYFFLRKDFDTGAAPSTSPVVPRAPAQGSPVVPPAQGSPVSSYLKNLNLSAR